MGREYEREIEEVKREGRESIIPRSLPPHVLCSPVQKADIALAPLSVMAERENVVDFTVPYYDLVGITILMKKPKVPTSLFKFLTVLEPEVWVCILFAYGFTR